MAGKRQATSDLNHDNWDRDEEPEERGTFRTATDDELKGRVIKKAKRKVVTGASDAADGGSASKSVFSGFSGFGKPVAAATTASSPFSFLAKIPASSGTGTSGGIMSSSATTSSSSATFSFGGSAATSTASTSEIPKTTMTFGSSGAAAKTTGSTSTANFSFGTTTTAAAKDDTKSSTKDKSENYYTKLKGLNQAVSEWIKSHVDKNPLCILTPIFKDYEKYLKELEEEKSKADKEQKAEAEKSVAKTTTTNAGIETFKFSESNTKAATITAAAPTFSFTTTTATTASSAEPAAKTNGFSFGLKKPEVTKDTKPAATTAGFSFGLKTPSTSTAAPATSTPTAAFSFGKPNSEEGSASKPLSFTPGSTPSFSFGNIKPPAEASATTETNNDDDDEEPPKNEFKQVVEEDAVYSKKCKVFVKKDGNFVDKGVGTLYLKPIESNGKTQLLVRADTNLGNILVNLILSSGLPSKRMGKNNVMLVGLPTPDVEKSTPMLFRVKTGEEADELLEKIEKYKK